MLSAYDCSNKKRFNSRRKVDSELAATTPVGSVFQMCGISSDGPSTATFSFRTRNIPSSCVRIRRRSIVADDNIFVVIFVTCQKGSHTGAVWRIRLIGGCAAAMRPDVKSLRPLVIFFSSDAPGRPPAVSELSARYSGPPANGLFAARTTLFSPQNGQTPPNERCVARKSIVAAAAADKATVT